jgi:two-component system cell cycle sensor histidine kinase/response regulator CckA
MDKQMRGGLAGPFMAVILLVDDEDIVLRLATIALKRAGHTVYTAKSGAEADRLAAELSHIDVLIVNHRIHSSADASENGRAIAERLVHKHADAKVIQISGYPREYLEQEASLFPGAAYLSKPFTLRQVQDSVAALFASS